MAINIDPSVTRQNHREYIPGTKKLGQGQISQRLHHEFTSQKEEREWVDALLDCSPQDEDFDAVVNCLRWEEAAVGWRLTLPNVMYITQVSDSNTRKDAVREKEKENSKNKNSQRLISFESDLSWKHCVEPGTYRYIHKSAYAGIQKKKTVNKGPVKRPVDANLQEHIRQVKEHLEKVLLQQASPKVHQRLLGSVQNRGDYVASLIREAKPRRSQPHVDTTYSLRPGNMVDEQAQIQTKVPDVGLTYTIKQGSPVQKSPLPHHPPYHPENKTPNDLVAALGFKLNELIQQDNVKNGIRTTKQSKNKTKEKLRSSYEKFTIPAQVKSPSLKPLVKVTPGQRKIYDDNEFIGAVARMNKQVAFQSDESRTSIRTSPTPSKENQIAYHRESKTVKEDVPNQMYMYEQLDPANRNFFTRGISGKAVSPTDVEVRVQNLAGVSSMLAKNPVKVKKRGTLYPQKLASVPVAGRGDHGFSMTNRLGDTLHRGVVDRGVAGAIASELLPGVSGHKIRFPMQQAYRII